MKNLKLIAACLLVLVGPLCCGQITSASSSPSCPPGMTYDETLKACNTPIRAPGIPHANTDTSQKDNIVATILSLLFGIIGALALLMIVVSGLRYVLSGGDPGRISKAKDGIIYSLVGLLIALVAEAIVAFVVNRL